jgi:hypothetical protein
VEWSRPRPHEGVRSIPVSRGKRERARLERARGRAGKPLFGSCGGGTDIGCGGGGDRVGAVAVGSGLGVGQEMHFDDWSFYIFPLISNYLILY